jgi:hypothetical protein
LCDVNNQLFGWCLGLRSRVRRRLGFDGRSRLGIHARRALGLTLRTTLGIPRLSVGSHAVGVGADRLALTLAARRQRLAIRAQTRLLRWALLASILPGRVLHVAFGTWATRTPWAARTTRTAIAIATAGTRASLRTFGTGCTTIARAAKLSAARTAWTTTATTGTAWTTTAAITITASATRTTTAAITKLAWRRLQLPADARARHLAATRTIVFLLLFLRRAHLQAAEAARLVAIAATTEATAATTAATAATTIATATAAITSIAAIIATLRRARDAIDHVVKLAARHRTVRTRFALEHAHEANLIDAIADDVERLEQARRAISLHGQRRGHVIDRRIRRSRGLRVAAFARLATLRRAHLGRLLAFCGSVGRRRFGSGLGCGRCGLHRGSLTRVGSFAQEERRELGQGLHGRGLLHHLATGRQGQTAPENANADEGLALRRHRQQAVMERSRFTRDLGEISRRPSRSPRPRPRPRPRRSPGCSSPR